MVQLSSPPRALRLSLGATVGGAYRVERLIGSGSMGAVYAATELATGTLRALKVMSLKLIGDVRALHRFEREARLGGRIASSGVVHTLAAGTDEPTGLKWIAMEYVEGQGFEEWLATRPTAEEVRGAVQQLLRAVAAAHALGVVHRDLKPANLLVVHSPAGPRLKVLDFGVAKAVGSATGSHTQEGLGTPMWTAPEQATAGHAPAPSADVWALGLLVFRMLTGKCYWLSVNRDGPLTDILVELLRRPIEPASARAAELGCEDHLPAGFDPWFSRCVNRDPKLRFRDAGQALDALAPRLGLQARRRGVRAWLRSLREAPRPARVAVALLIVALTAAVVFAFVRRAAAQPGRAEVRVCTVGVTVR
jgi:eukaryotic-like serine/threonine-protein kinase